MEPGSRRRYSPAFPIECVRQTADNFVLSISETSAVGVELLAPWALSGFGVDQQHIQPNLLPCSPHTAFEDVPDVELTADLLNVRRLVFVGKGGIASDYYTSGDSRQKHSQVFGDSVGEIFLPQIARSVRKGEDDDRQRRFRRRRLRRLLSISAGGDVRRRWSLRSGGHTHFGGRRSRGAGEPHPPRRDPHTCRRDNAGGDRRAS